MSNSCCRIVLLSIVGLLSFLFFSNTPTGLQPTEFPQFKLDKELKEIPGLDLDRLKHAQYIQIQRYTIEDVAVDNDGNVYAIAGNGPSYIYSVSPTNISIHNVHAQTQGRVIGTALNKQGNQLVFLDEKLGIRLINLVTNQVKTLLSPTDQGYDFKSFNSITWTDNPDILYFTHSCNLSMEIYHMEILYKTGTGGIYELNLKTGKVRNILYGLQFPNGIVYSAKDNCLYVNEIGLYRVIKIPFTQISNNPEKVKNISVKYTVVIDNLLGYPDNLKITEEGDLWIAIPSLRDKVNIFIDNHPVIRKALINARIPQFIFTKFANFSYSGGLKVNPRTGKIIDYFFGKSDKIYFVTSIVQRNGKLYMSSLKNKVIAVIDYI